MTEAENREKLMTLIDKYDMDAIGLFDFLKGIERIIDEQVKKALEEIEKSLPSDDDLLMVGEKSRLPVKHFRDFTQEAINKLK